MPAGFSARSGGPCPPYDIKDMTEIRLTNHREEPARPCPPYSAPAFVASTFQPIALYQR